MHAQKDGIDRLDRGLREGVVGNETVFIADTGWYDIFSESALDYFAAFASTGRMLRLSKES